MEILNRKAKYDYEILEVYEAGIVLTGTEIKSVRLGHVNIKDSYVIVKNGELFLLNTHISAYEKGNIFNHDETRTRKLLMHKNEIRKIGSKVEQLGYTLIPLKIYFKNGIAKIEVGLCRGKKTVDKRETIKQRDIERQMEKDYKYR